MRIERVSLRDFLVFRDLGLAFAPGLTVVLAPNEAGKSSLLRGIVTGLYTGSSTQKSGTASLTRWGSPRRFAIELDLELGGETFHLARDYETKEQTISRLAENAPAAKGKAVDAFLLDRMPIRSEDLFMRVCGVRHEELSRVGEGGSSAGEELEEILGGGWGDVTPAKVQKIVDDRRKELVRGRDHPVNEENRGQLKRLMDEVKALESDLARAEAVSRERERLMKEIASADARIDALREELEVLETKRERSAELATIEKDEGSLRDRGKELKARMDRIEKLLDRRGVLAEAGRRFPPALARGESAALKSMRDELAREALLEEGAGREAPGAPRPPLSRLAAGLILALGGLCGALLWQPLLWIVAAAGAALVAWYLADRSGRTRASAPDRAQADLEALRERRASWSDGCSRADAKNLLEACEEWVGEGRDVQSRLEEAVGGPGLDARAVLAALDDQYGNVALEARALAERRAALEPFRLDAAATLRLGRAIEDAAEALAALSAGRSDADRALGALERLDGPAVAERLEFAAEALALSERKERVLTVILDVLREARTGMAGFLSRHLPSLAGEYLSRITGGRYRTILIDPHSLEVEVVPPAALEARAADGTGPPEKMAPDALSQGARDQVYLAVRLALIELMSRGEAQPLFLDDPFVHFDPERRARALELVREFARSHQVVLFTCDPAYRDAGDRLVELAARP